MHHVYKTHGTCATRIEFDLEDGRIHNVVFTGGCNGNLQAIPALIEGAEPEFVISRVKGIQCGYKKTSCSDQLANALIEAMEKEKA